MPSKSIRQGRRPLLLNAPCPHAPATISSPSRQTRTLNPTTHSAPPSPLLHRRNRSSHPPHQSNIIITTIIRKPHRRNPCRIRTPHRALQIRTRRHFIHHNRTFRPLLLRNRPRRPRDIILAPGALKLNDQIRIREIRRRGQRPRIQHDGAAGECGARGARGRGYVGLGGAGGGGGGLVEEDAVQGEVGGAGLGGGPGRVGADVGLHVAKSTVRVVRADVADCADVGVRVELSDAGRVVGAGVV